jgi:YHS domain-containing protein
MTAIMRQMRKQILTIGALVVALTCSSWVLAADGGVVVDPLTGVAAAGLDPVTYFIEAEPRQGLPDNEFRWQGVPWYFVSAANRDVFARTPEIYAPQFGGLGAMSLARGYRAEGNPRIYARYKLKLYFFYSVANREAFLLSPDAAIAAAEANWQRFSRPSAPNPLLPALPARLLSPRNRFEFPRRQRKCPNSSSSRRPILRRCSAPASAMT